MIALASKASREEKATREANKGPLSRQAILVQPPKAASRVDKTLLQKNMPFSFIFQLERVTYAYLHNVYKQVSILNRLL